VGSLLQKIQSKIEQKAANIKRRALECPSEEAWRTIPERECPLLNMSPSDVLLMQADTPYNNNM